MKKATPQKKGNLRLFTIALKPAEFEALERQANEQDIKWRSLAQQYIKQAVAATLPQKETPATTETAGA